MYRKGESAINSLPLKANCSLNATRFVLNGSCLS